MADASESDADILDRLREQATAFQSQTDFNDARVNDGNNYKGLMNAADYKRRRLEVLEDPAVKKAEALAAARSADRDARAREARERDDREAARKEKLRRQLAEAEGDGDEAVNGNGDGGGGEADAERKRKKKKKRKAGEEGALSFDVDE